jgi:gliding motility-associated-like protein
MQVTISPLGDPGISSAPPTFCDNLTAPINVFNLLGGNPSNVNDVWIMPDGSTYTGITTDLTFDVTTASPADPTYPTYVFTHEVSLGSCSTQATVTIDVSEPLTATVTADHEICDDAETDLEVLTTNEGLAPYFYQWSFNGTNIAGLEDLMSYAPDASGDYCVTITDACNHNIQPCVHIDVRPKAPVTIDALTTTACWPDPFNLSITTDPALYQDSYWEISSGQTFMNMPNLNLQMENPGTYDVSLTLEDDLGCIYDTIIYNYFESYAPPTAGWLASEDEVSSFDPLVSFTNMTEGNIVSYSWTFDNANDQFYSEEYEPTFTYPFGVGGIYEVELQVIDINGCIDVATGNIEVQEPFLFFIPTGFTPNGDNINDALQIVSNDLDETVFEMTIFNRWGQTVFHTNDPRMPWMGQQMDSEYYVPNGVYMWNATVRAKATGEKKEINGTITITR